MALKIRLSRRGAHKDPFYHIVVMEARSKSTGRSVDKVGYYNPCAAAGTPKAKIDAEKAKYWISVGAKATDRVQKFLADANVVEATENIIASTKAHLPKKKAQERAKARAANAAAMAKIAADEAAAKQAERAEKQQQTAQLHNDKHNGKHNDGVEEDNNQKENIVHSSSPSISGSAPQEQAASAKDTNHDSTADLTNGMSHDKANGTTNDNNSKAADSTVANTTRIA